MAFKVPNQFRLRQGPLGSDDSIGLCGAFEVLLNKAYKFTGSPKSIMHVIADDGRETGWEHVSCYKTTGKTRWTPNWKEMCIIKDLFWDEEDCVIQYHPPKQDYVNCNPYVLHLWRPVDIELPRPPKILVGI